jgi:hypothetical protein
MPQIIKPATKVRIVPREGELEITLNINITVDGQVVATTNNANVATEEFEESSKEREATHFIPDFTSGFKINFGKKEGA